MTVDSKSGMSRNHKPADRASDPASDDCLIDVRFDNEFIVVADIPGISTDDLSVGINSRAKTLIIRTNKTVLGRVPLPWDSVEMTAAWFNNGILEVRLQPAKS
jgi:HSP20 family molecular chaperone IbpA